MKSGLKVIGVLIIALLVAGAASADDRDDRNMRKFAFGLGLGLADPSDNAEDDTEAYFTANFRYLLGDLDQRDWQQDVIGALELEVGYWGGGRLTQFVDNSLTVEQETDDLLIGLNLLGIIPFQSVDFFFGAGAGIHFFDASVDVGGFSADTSGSTERLGVNLQVGIDVSITETLVLFGVGRFDLIEGDIHEEQAKIYLGIRFRFG